MGENTLPNISYSFNKSIKINFGEQDLTSHSGYLVIRETLQRTEIVKWLSERIKDPREPNKIHHPMTEILSTCILRPNSFVMTVRIQFKRWSE